MMPAEEVDLARLVQERDELKAHCLRLAGEVNCLRIAQFNASLGFPPGHFYSPVIDVDDPHVVRSVRDPQPIRDSAGIHMDQPGMEALCERLARHLPYFPFGRERQAGFRYFYDNPAFGAHDAAVLFSMLLEYRPRRVVEVGSGYSSCLMLDTSERFLDGKLQLALIDPTLKEIRARVPLGSAHGVEMIPVKVQDAPISVFESLQENDILFLDSSHVAKCGSDVNYYLFEILPFLAPGVLIHITTSCIPSSIPSSGCSKVSAVGTRRMPCAHFCNITASSQFSIGRALRRTFFRRNCGRLCLSQRRIPAAVCGSVRERVLASAK